MRRLGPIVLFCASLAVMAAGQTKGPGTASPQPSAAKTARAVPTIKCVDQDAGASCKSFKELVEARDEQILGEILGEPGHKRGHISYVCLRPRSDAFSVIYIDVPGPEDYRAPSTITEALARYADDTLPTNRQFRETLEATKKDLEDMEFSDFSDPPAIGSYIKEQWFQDHSKSLVYSSAGIIDFLYQDGVDAGSESDFGEWSMLATDKDGRLQKPATWFVGGYAWIERFNLQHADVSTRDDDPEHGHITADPDTIRIHYKFKNVSGAMIDYTLQIHRVTGRFVEVFSSPDGNDQVSGSCLIFK